MSGIRKIRLLQASRWVQALEVAALCALILYVGTLLAPNYTYSIPAAAQNTVPTTPAAPTPVPGTPPYAEFGHTGFKTQYAGPDPQPGVVDYNFTSPDNGPGPQVIRVLKPTHPTPGVAHNFLFSLPVAPGVDNSQYGDGLDMMAALNAENTYNLTVIEPSFAIDPWYADNPANPAVDYQTFMATQLEPWAKATLSSTGREQSWLIGFSKSGVGGQDLLFKYPAIFALAASWDFPANMTSLDSMPGSVDNYGSQDNFAANYELSPGFLEAHSAPFQSRNRIWIGGFAMFGGAVAYYDSLLTSLGIEHSAETPTQMSHAWYSGWVPLALAALYRDSLAQPS
jgi:hypothetical protein